ncbi:MAG: DUF3306 domain-containing protein [Burkholderiales bacterium]
MTKDPEPFLSRWSRLKREREDVEQAPVSVPNSSADASKPSNAQTADEPLPDLPPIDQLTPESDFRPFMDPRVPEALRRMALKKLYADPHFNVQDMLDDYAGDYTLLEALPAGMVGKLAHARRTLLGQDEADRIEAEERQIAEQAAAERAPPQPEDVSEAPRVAQVPDQSAAEAQSRPSGKPQDRNG